jgi:hypothetical protein
VVGAHISVVVNGETVRKMAQILSAAELQEEENTKK